MDSEWFSVLPEEMARIERARARGSRIVAVGTTVARVLETLAPDWPEYVASGETVSGETRIFIRPPYVPRLVSGLVTNFQYPRLPVICMAATFVGLERLRILYRDAVARDYAFYSLGDAMLLLFGSAE